MLLHGDINGLLQKAQVLWTQALRLSQAQVVNMVLPLILPAAMLAISAIEALYNVYSTQKTTEALDAQARYQQTFYGGAQLENSAYFDRYIRMHHLQNREILYPYRSGMNFNASQIYGSNSQLVHNEYSRYGSYVHGGASVGRSGIIGYGNSLYNGPKKR